MPKLSQAEIETQLGGLGGWSQSGDEIHRQWQFTDFVASMKFVNAVAALAEAAQHHPDIDIRYNKVKLALSTHSEGGLTEKDFALARAVENVDV